jgi:soluble lytic murein transglycosylase-like protein
VPQDCRLSVIPLFGHHSDHSSVPARVRIAVARSGGQGRSSGRRASASPLTAASTMAALRSLGRMLCIVTILAASILTCHAAHAGQVLLAKHRASARSVDTFAAFVTEASRRFEVPERWIRAVMHVESGAKQRARSSKGATGLDADHAKNLGRIARSAWSRYRSLRPPRQYSGWRRLH